MILAKYVDVKNSAASVVDLSIRPSQPPLTLIWQQNSCHQQKGGIDCMQDHRQ